MSDDDNFELDSQLAWELVLVTVCPLPKDDDLDGNLDTLNWLGRLYGFASRPTREFWPLRRPRNAYIRDLLFLR